MGAVLLGAVVLACGGSGAERDTSASTKPATYRCPLCRKQLPALAEHLLVLPEGDPARRRHAHTTCVMRARHAGRLPLREEVEPRRPGWLSRLLRRGTV